MLRLSVLTLGALALVVPAQSQVDPTVTVSNGATLSVQNGAVLDIQGGLLDLGGIGETARLNETGGARVANATLTATRTLNAPSAENVAGLGFTITTVADLGATTVTRTHAGATVNGQPAAERTYDVAPTLRNAALGATLVLAYAEAELDGLDEATLAAFRDGGDGFDLLASTAQPDANTVRATNVGSLGLFALALETVVPATLAGTLAYGGCPAPPSAIAEPRARCFLDVSGTNLLETPQRYTVFLVLNGIGGEAMGYSRRAFRGEIKLGPGQSAAQQVKLQTTEDDPAGTYTVSLIAAEGSVASPGPDAVTLDTLEVVKTGGAGLRADEPLAVFPNPAVGAATARFVMPEPAEARMSVYDALGREVARLVEGRVEGVVEAQVGGLAPGLYLVRLTTERGRSETVRLSVAR